MIRSPYRGWPVALLLGEDPSQTAQDSQELAAELGIRLIWLPKRCPERTSGSTCNASIGDPLRASGRSRSRLSQV
jgi:hypothetical protein